jgi:addiction module HigA family antidote
MPTKRLAPVHPGEILAEEFLKPLALTEYRLAKGLRVPARRINEIVHGKRAITADTALRLGRFFRNSPRFWLNLQSAYDLEVQAKRLDPTWGRKHCASDGRRLEVAADRRPPFLAASRPVGSCRLAPRGSGAPRWADLAIEGASLRDDR